MKQSIKQQITFSGAVKEAVMCLLIIGVLLTMDRCLENMYVYFLYDTGKWYLDIFMSLYLHAHRWFVWIIPAGFVCWIVWKLWKKETISIGVLGQIAAAYGLYLITSLLAEKKFPERWVNMTLYPMVMILFVTMACSTIRGAKRFFRVGTDVYIVLMALNALFTVFPQMYHLFTDWEPDYFLSADNLTGFPMMFGAMLALMDEKFNRKKARCRIYMGLFFLNQVLIHCISALIAAMILGIYLLLPMVRKVMDKISLAGYTGIATGIGAVLCSTAWVYFRNSKVYALLDPVLNVLKSLYIRFIIWRGVLKQVLKKPIFGYGLGLQAEFFKRPRTSLYYNAHNGFLQTLYEGGLVTMAGVMWVLFSTSRKLKACEDRSLGSLFAVILFADLIMMLGAITSWFTWYPVFVIAQVGVLTCRLTEE